MSWTTVMMEPSHRYTPVDDHRKEEIANNNLYFKQVVNVMNRSWMGATAGTMGDGDGPVSGEGAAEETSGGDGARQGSGRRQGNDRHHHVVELLCQRVAISWKTGIRGLRDLVC